MKSDTLKTKLEAVLASRDDRHIRRSLPASPTAPLIDFTSNDYLSLAASHRLRSHFLAKLSTAHDVLGPCGSRLLVNGHGHAQLEDRLRQFFGAEAALLFNSGFDANVGFFSCVPQRGDVVVYDEHVHASVHDGMRASRVDRESLISFAHNSLEALRSALTTARRRMGQGQSVLVAVESLYSMDGTFAPLADMVGVIDDVFPAGNAYLVVDEAHSTGIYGPQGRGRVALLGLEDRVLARVHTFGKALAASGAVVVTSNVVKDYLVNYARPLVYSTCPTYATIIAADAAFDMLTDGTASWLSERLLILSARFTQSLTASLSRYNIPASLVAIHKNDLSPIVPVLTPYPRSLSACLLRRGMNARPITWPTVPKGKDRVRVCLHAGNTTHDVDRLVCAIVEWADGMVTSKL